MVHTQRVFVSAIILFGAAALVAFPHARSGHPFVAHAQTEQPPTFERDASWPKPLPNNWGIGIVWGVAVGPQDHVWVLNAVDGYLERLEEEGKIPAPPVLEFDQEGNLVRAWGGRDQGFPWFHAPPPDSAPQGLREHALNVDDEGNVWISGGNHLVLKFSSTGEFLMQLGERNQTSGSNHPTHLGAPASVDFNPTTNEVYVADGYLNRRVAVYDARTGEYKRHWGRYGEPPDDSFEPHPRDAWEGPGPNGTFPRFAHGVNVSHDGLVYVADRAHSLVHLYTPDGTFVTQAPTPGPINSVGFSADPEQYYLYGAGINRDSKIYIMRRSDFEVLGEFNSSGQHYFDTDSHGNLFTCGRSLPEKFVLTSCPRGSC